jgi:predicted sulfurtransferase
MNTEIAKYEKLNNQIEEANRQITIANTQIDTAIKQNEEIFKKYNVKNYDELVALSITVKNNLDMSMNTILSKLNEIQPKLQEVKNILAGIN